MHNKPLLLKGYFIEQKIDLSRDKIGLWSDRTDLLREKIDLLHNKIGLLHDKIDLLRDKWLHIELQRPIEYYFQHL